jgi:hypothetical protein
MPSRGGEAVRRIPVDGTALAHAAPKNPPGRRLIFALQEWVSFRLGKRPTQHLFSGPPEWSSRGPHQALDFRSGMLRQSGQCLNAGRAAARIVASRYAPPPGKALDPSQARPTSHGATFFSTDAGAKISWSPLESALSRRRRRPAISARSRRRRRAVATSALRYARCRIKDVGIVDLAALHQGDVAEEIADSFPQGLRAVAEDRSPRFHAWSTGGDTPRRRNGIGEELHVIPPDNSGVPGRLGRPSRTPVWSRTVT